MNTIFLPNRIRNRIKRTIKNLRTRLTEQNMKSVLSLSDKDFFSFLNLKEIKKLISKEEFETVKEKIVQHYINRSPSSWPKPPGVLTDLRLNLDELSKEEIISRAELILKFDISPDGNPIKLREDGNIDWYYNPISSPEWLWRLNRHQWWPVLGLAYSETGDERYAKAFVEQIMDWIDTNPPPRGKNEKSPTWRLMEVGLRLRVSWIPCFALFIKSDTFNDEAKLKMLGSIYDHAKFLSLYKTKKNHLLRESNGLAYAGVYFPEFDEAEKWLSISLARFDEELKKQINQDGSQIELSTGYQWLVVDEFEKIYELLDCHKLSLPTENLAFWLEKMYAVLAYLIRPDGTFPEINDGFIRWDRKRLIQAGKKFNRSDFIFIGANGQKESPPQIKSIGFEDAGLFVMRSDWEKDARYLLFDAGPYGGHHGHEDKLNIEVFAYGQAFIVDTGSYTYDRKDPFRNYFVGSQGHNTVLVDGQSQIRRWNKINMRPKPAKANHATWVSKEDFDYTSSNYCEGYSTFSLKKPKNPKIIEDVIHTRRILFVKPDYWVIVDELEASGPHTYQLLFHTPPEINIRPYKNNSVVLTTTQSDACLYIIPADKQNIRMSKLAGCEDPIQGWFSIDHHFKVPSNTIIFERKNSVSTILCTLLYPRNTNQTGGDVSINSINVTGGKGIGFVVKSNHTKDYLLFAYDHKIKETGPLKSKRDIAFLRTDNNINIIKQFEDNINDNKKKIKTVR